MTELPAKASARSLPPLRRQIYDDTLPLSASQLIWFPVVPTTRVEQMRFIVPFRLTGPLAAPVLEAAFQRLIERHEILRTRYEVRSGEPVQIILPGGYPVIEPIDLSGAPPSEVDHRIWQILKEEQDEARTDLSTGRMIRARLFKLAAQDHVLHIGVCHIAFDPHSATLLARDLFRFYRAELSGEAVDLPALGLQYADYVLWERSWQGDAKQAEAEARWRALLDGEIGLDLSAGPVDAKGPPAMCYAAPMLDFAQLDVTGVSGLARRMGATQTMVFLAGVSALLARWSEQDKLVFGYPVTNRPLGAGDMIGCFSRIRPFQIDLRGDPSFIEVITRVRASYLRSIDRKLAPGHAYLQDLNLNRVMVNIIPQEVKEADGTPLASGLQIGPWHRRLVTRSLMTPQLEVRINLGADQVSGYIIYAGGRVDEARAKWFAAELPGLINRAITSPERALSALVPDLP